MYFWIFSVRSIYNNILSFWIISIFVSEQKMYKSEYLRIFLLICFLNSVRTRLFYGVFHKVSLFAF